MSKNLAGVVVVILCLIASPAKADDQLFRDEQYLFRILYPAGWAQTKPRGKHVRVSVTNEGGRGLANCNVVVRPMQEFANLSRAELDVQTAGLFTQEFMKEVIEANPGTKIIWTKEDKLDNRPAGFARIDMTYQTMGIRIEATNLVAVAFTRQGMFLVTCGAVKEYFETVQRELVKILASFAFEDYTP